MVFFIIPVQNFIHTNIRVIQHRILIDENLKPFVTDRKTEEDVGERLQLDKIAQGKWGILKEKTNMDARMKKME